MEEKENNKKKTRLLSNCFPHGLTTPFRHLALQNLSADPTLSLQVPYWPRVVFGPGRTWQDKPWPVLFMLAHGNAIWLVWMITTATARWPAASRNQGHSTSALRTFPALFSSACRWIIHPVQLGGTSLQHKHLKKKIITKKKKCTLNYTDTITCDEKMFVPVWTAKINSSWASL